MSLSIRLFGNRDRAQELVGKAKKQMVALKHFMGFGNISQLEPQPIRMSDGSTIRVRSIFGIDIIDIIGAGVVLVEVGELIPANFLFLITSPTEYAAWALRKTNEGTELIPSSFDLSTIQQFILPGYAGHSLVQSKDDYSKHKYMISTIFNTHFDHSGVCDTNDNYTHIIYNKPRYGVSQPSLCNGGPIVWGLRNSYGPIIQPDGTIIRKFNSDQAYLSYNQNRFSITYPFYCGSARHNWQIEDNGDVLTDLEIWAINSVTSEIRWKDKNGDQSGAPITRDASLDALPYGVLSKDKFIGAGDSSPIVNTVTTPLYYPATCDGSSSWHSLAYGPIGKIVSGGFDWNFGDILIEEAMGSVKKEFSSSGWSSPGDVGTPSGGDGDCLCPSPSSAKITNIYKAMYGRIMAPVSYDNLDNDDKTFIMIYFRDSGDPTQITYEKKEYNVWSTPFYASGFNSEQSYVLQLTEPKIREYFLIYRINGGELIKILITRISKINTKWESKFSYYSWLGCSPLRTWSTTYIDTPYIEGSSIFEPSCIIVKNQYLFYTYILRDYVGPVTGCGDFIDCQESGHWSFSKRLLGVIDIATGKRTEHIVDDDLLGKLYKDTFDKTKAAAIGWHKEGG